MKRLLALPVFENDVDKTRVAGLLNAILLAAVAATVMLIVATPIVSSDPGAPWLFESVLVLLELSALVLMRHGHVQLASALFTSGAWVYVTLVTFAFGGVRSPNMVSYISVVLIAGILGGKRAGVSFAGLSALAGSGMLYAEMIGVLPAPVVPITSAGWWLTLTANLIMATALLYLATRSVEDALARAHRSAHTLAEKNRELETQAEALRRAEAKYRTLVEHLPAVVYMDNLDETASTRYISPPVEALVGYTPDEWIADPTLWPRLLHPEDRDRVLSANLHHNTTGEPFSEEYRLLARDGRAAWVRDEAVMVLDDAGRPLFSQGMMLDITERKQRERELEAIVVAAAALRAAPTRGDMLPVIVDQVRNLLKADGASLATRDEATGDTVFALARGEWAGWTGVRLAPGEGITGHVIATGRPYLNGDVTSDPRLARRDLIGDLRAVACAPLIALGETIGALWVGRKSGIAPSEARLISAIADIAANALHRAQIVETLERRIADRTRELAEANEHLQELDRLKSKFVSEVSHELRTPVANLKLYLELFERGKPEKRDLYMRTLKNQTKRLQQLVEDILNLSRLELGGDRVQFSPVDLIALADQIVVVHRPVAEMAGVTLLYEPEAGVPPVLGERNQLAQVITNLITNAINYSPAGDAIHVSARMRNRQACLEVRDTGMGIHSDDLPHLFERFYRGRHASQLDTPGSGLGLAIVKEIVDLHRGTIEVESDVGKGSTFRVWLPVERGEAVL